ncbi:outer membrane beta-barrel protein [Hoeflea sp. CAU 1731]
MMFHRTKPALVLTLILCASAPAGAADLDDILYAPELQNTVPVEIGSGWYLRGDVGYNVSFNGSASSYRVFDPFTLEYYDQPYSSSEFNSDFTYGLGAGYQFTDWFRAEAMFNAFGGDFSGTGVSAYPCLALPGGPDGTGCSRSGESDFTARGGMVNGYVDLGTYAGFTPYFGAGVGMTYVNYDNYISKDTCINGIADCAGATFGTQFHEGLGSWRFTYSLMAGIAYDITRNLKADLGYRFTDIASGGKYGYDSTAVGAGASGTQSSDDGFTSQEIRFSLRYSLW